MRKDKKGFAMMKYWALAALILQNAGQALVMRYSMISAEPSERYRTSTAVLMSEIFKLVIATCACFAFDGGSNVQKFMGVLKTDGRSDWLKLMLPSLLYTLQNSLQYMAMAKLSAPVFQVLYQMKIITTAVFSVLILSRRMTPLQWSAVVLLTVGVACVQLSQTKSDDADNSFIGFVYVLCGCCTSGFAGVYFEMVLKSSKASIWIRNIQLSVIGIVCAACACFYMDGAEIAERGFFHGYSVTVATVITFQAAGGLIVAIVVKYADNVMKNFATSFSIILSSLASAYFFHDIQINAYFLGGGVIVLTSVYAFGYVPPVKVVTRADLELGVDMSAEKDDRDRDPLLGLGK